MLTRSTPAALAILGLLVAAACNGEGLPNALTDCPSGSEVSWSDVQPIFVSHCTSCHSSENTGPARVGAKELVDYDTADLAYNSAGTTPEVSWYEIYANTMPPGQYNVVPDADALLIHEWLSCGGPE